MKMHEQLATAGLRKGQRLATTPSKKAQERRTEKLVANLSRRYVHISRALQQDPDGGLDYEHKELRAPGTTLVQRLYPKGRTYRVGSNALKRTNRRGHVKARSDERRAVARG